MNSPEKPVNVPTEVARTLLTVQEAGSLTKAAQILGLTQPGISSQMRRIEMLVGGPIFEKSAHGSQITELGKAVLLHCRKMMEANDQILAIGGIAKNSRLLRLGVSSLLIRTLLTEADPAFLTKVSVCAESSAVLSRRLLDRHLDIALLLEGSGARPLEIEPFIRREFMDDLIWVRSGRFVIRLGEPIPIITWAGENDPMTRVLTSKGIPFRIAFSGGDFETKKLAVETGMGLTCLPKRRIPPNLMAADEYQLPKLPQVTGMLCVSPDIEDAKAAAVIDWLLDLFFNTPK